MTDTLTAIDLRLVEERLTGQLSGLGVFTAQGLRRLPDAS